MKLSHVHLKGFRNFKNAKINFSEKSLIIGSNDVGKTNLLWGLRLLLDKGLSAYDIEPKDSDFYAYDETHSFSITLYFEEVKGDGILSRLKGMVGDEESFYLKYEASRDENTRGKSYTILAGPKESLLEETTRYYQRAVSLQYVRSSRDFRSYIKREKKELLIHAREQRDKSQVEKDESLFKEIQEQLGEVDKQIPELNYVKSATSDLNKELESLSFHHRSQNITFDAAASDLEDFISNIRIAAKAGGKKLVIGGDGRLNQMSV